LEGAAPNEPGAISESWAMGCFGARLCDSCARSDSGGAPGLFLVRFSLFVVPLPRPAEVGLAGPADRESCLEGRLVRPFRQASMCEGSRRATVLEIIGRAASQIVRNNPGSGCANMCVCAYLCVCFCVLCCMYLTDVLCCDKMSFGRRMSHAKHTV